MAQMPCESSLRPDWITRTFKSATARHQQQVWDLVQAHTMKIADDTDFEVTTASRHFERCFKHDIGVRFETSSLSAERNPGLSVVSFSGTYFALSSVYEQMRLIDHLFNFRGGYHWTRLDAQITTLNPTQSAEQIVEDINNGSLWIKGYSGWEPKGLRDINGNVINGASACFGAPTSNKRATSYNKAAQQGWPVPARRDETRLRDDWAEQHMNAIATAISGASCENEAIEAYQRLTAACVAQHMQYLDITGQPKPRPKNWARKAKVPAWWSETLETEIEPLRLNRKPVPDIEERFAYMKSQWARTFAEYLSYRVSTRKSESFIQATLDASLALFQHAKREDIERLVLELPEPCRKPFWDAWEGSVAVAASHSEHVL